MYQHLLPIAAAFGLTGIQGITPLTSGNVNATFRLVCAEGDFVLQKLNRVAFPRPEALMDNIRRVTAHLMAAGERTLTFLPTREGTCLYRDEQGNHWRLSLFIHGATGHDRVTHSRQLYEAGRGFGRFQRALVDFPAGTLAETIPGFHHTPRRYAAFEEAVAADAVGRAAEVAEEIAFLRQRRERMGALAAADLPCRVTHNDTKLNNLLLDDVTGEAVCVIDLDTVMPGLVAYDFGDAVRFGAATAAEDEADLPKIGLDMSLFRAFTDGFLAETGDVLTPEERRTLPLGVWTVTAELAMRFLTDYLNGDTYFTVRYPGHNRTRARAQMALLSHVESLLPAMEAYIADCKR